MKVQTNKKTMKIMKISEYRDVEVSLINLKIPTNG